jgi:transposase-like protein
MEQLPERDWSAFACPNPRCPAFGLRGQNNLRPHGWSSKASGIRCLRCTRCGQSFSEREGTPRFGTRLPEEKAVPIAQPLAEGAGMRPTSRLCAVSLNTVLRFAVRAGPHAEGFPDELVQHVAVRQVPADEAWSFVGKKS